MQVWENSWKIYGKFVAFILPFNSIRYAIYFLYILVMINVYKQIELQQMEWCSRDTIYKHIDRFVPVYIHRWKKTSKRYLSREDSLIYLAWLQATKQERWKAFCETAFDTIYMWDIPAYDLVIVWHYADGRQFDMIFYQWEELESINKINWLKSLLIKLRTRCYPPKDWTKQYIQVFDEKEIELFNIRKWKKRGNKYGSRMIIDGFGRKLK